MSNYDILEKVPDKRQEKNTTSLKFKKDVIDFLGDKYKNKLCLEIGTHKGYTTRILSTLFKKVITCETNTDYINFAKDLNKDRDNIEFLQKDVYETSWDFKDIDVVFIDCNHEISYVIKDIQNAINLAKENQELLIIFDDYGLQNPWEGVKEAVDKFAKENPRFEIIKFIGEHKGSDCNPRANLRDEEGVICTYTNRHLQKFWRIFDGKVYDAGDVLKIGFEESDGLRIPDDYLDKQEFVVMRTCHGFGDWAVISAMPRLLKQKYPDCKVYVPSVKFYEKLFENNQQNWSSWDNPFENLRKIFDNNPYVDGYKDEIKDEIFHDHYRIYNNLNVDVPLVEQMLKFWQFTEEEYKDSQPEIYWSDEEKELGDKIIKEYVGDKDFGCFLISDRYDFSNDNLIIKKLEENPIPYFYYSSIPLEQTSFNFIDKVKDMRHIDIRIQSYIRSKAKVNIGNQCGTSQLVTRYSDVYDIKRQFPIAHNFVRGEKYLTDDFKRDLLSHAIRKSVSKTTTSMKFKADIIDFFRDGYGDKVMVEIGTSLGHGTKVLSGLFKKVITVDNSPEKLNYAKDYLKSVDNVEFKMMDVYNENWDFQENADVVFIDCVHTYQHLKSDIDNSLNTFDKPILMFDDYGLFPDLKKLIDEYIEAGKLKLLKKIGQHTGKIYPKTQNKILKDREGIICQGV